jgi:cytochrome c biogenesis protein CcdA
VLPLLVFAGLLASGNDLSSKLTQRFTRYQRRITQVSGAVFILTGVNDTLTYWLI